MSDDKKQLPDGQVEVVETVVEVTEAGRQAAQALPSEMLAEAYVAIKAQKREDKK